MVAEQLVHNPVRGGGLRGFLPVQSSTAFGEVFMVQRFLELNHQDFSPGQSSTAVRRDGRPVGGPQNFVPGQSSRALGGADDVEDLIWRSQELLENTRREYSFSSEDEEVEEEEEETEQMDLEEQPSRFQGHFRPRRYCSSILRGGLYWRGSSCTFAHSNDELHPDVQRHQ